MLEGVQIYFSHLRDYEITKGKPNLEKFIDEMNKIEAYTQTKNSPQYLLDVVAKEHLKVTLDSNSHFFFLFLTLTCQFYTIILTWETCGFSDCLKTVKMLPKMTTKLPKMTTKLPGIGDRPQLLYHIWALFSIPVDCIKSNGVAHRIIQIK
jgi:hypothetical protein